MTDLKAFNRSTIDRAWAWHAWTPRWLPSRGASLLKRWALASFAERGICTLDTGRKMAVSLSDVIQCTIARAGEWEGPIHQSVRRYVRPGDIALDVGGHVGYSMLHFADWVGPKGKVFVFEPLESNARWIEANAGLNEFGDRVEVVRAAVGDHAGVVRFARSSPLNTGMGAIAPNGGGLSVPMIALDEWLGDRRIDDVALLKLDIEGAEGLAIQGLERTLSRKRISTVFMEVHPTLLPSFGSSTSAVLQRLTNFGYRLAYWDNVGAFIDGPIPADCTYVLASA